MFALSTHIFLDGYLQHHIIYLHSCTYIYIYIICRERERAQRIYVYIYMVYFICIYIYISTFGFSPAQFKSKKTNRVKVNIGREKLVAADWQYGLGMINFDLSPPLLLVICPFPPSEVPLLLMVPHWLLQANPKDTFQGYESKTTSIDARTMSVCDQCQACSKLLAVGFGF